MNLRSGIGPTNAQVMVVGEAFGEVEDRLGRPFEGYSGQELTRMLAEAGINRGECFVTNVVNARPSGNDFGVWVAMKKKEVTAEHISLRDKKVLPIVVKGLENLRFEIGQVKPNLIIALGNWPMWALTGEWGITKWRGSQMYTEVGGVETKLVPTYHPAAITRQYDWRAIAIHDLRRAKREADSRNRYKVPEWHFDVRPSFTQVITHLQELYNRLERGPFWIEFDLETASGHIDCVGLSWSLTRALCIPIMAWGKKEGYWTLDEEAHIVWWLSRVLRHPNVLVRGQNLLYDCQYTYRHWHWVPRVAQDTMISQHIMFPGQPKSLAFQASMYCEHYIYWKDDGKSIRAKGRPEDQGWIYNATDCVRTRECGETELEAIPKMGLEKQHEFHQQLFWPTLFAMQRGIRIDRKERDNFAMELQIEMAKRDQFLIDVLGHTLNPRSHKQLIAFFYQDMGLQPIMSVPKKGSPSHVTCDDEALEIIKVREPLLRHVCQAIQELRSLGVFLSTFVGATLDVDGRMRCSFNICGTESYRYSSSENAFGSGTNLQNVPMGGEEDDSDLKLPNVRKLFVPDPGFTWYDIDLSKADLRVVVWESKEEELKAMLAEGRDPYVETAREFYHDPTLSKSYPSGEINPRYRTFKSFAHGSHYLGTPRGLSRRLGLSVHEVERTQSWYFGKFPKIKIWQQDLKRRVSEKRYVENAFGYRRHYFERIDDAVFRKAAAWIPQSTIGILIDHIWLRFYSYLKEVETLLQVHDSLAGQFPTHLKEKCTAKMKELAVVAIPYDDPLVIPVGIKTSEKSWGDCQ